MQFSKFIVGMIITLNLGFTIAVLVIFLRIGNEPTALIAAWFAFTTGELWLLAGIKRTRLREGDQVKDEKNLH